MFILNVLIGFFSGIIGGMGVGGGAILIPLIRIIEGIDQITAQSQSALFHSYRARRRHHTLEKQKY